jgi:hypothetical protein
MSPKLDKPKLCISNASKVQTTIRCLTTDGRFMTHLGSHDVAEKPYTGTSHSIIFFIQGNSSIQMKSTTIENSNTIPKAVFCINKMMV